MENWAAKDAWKKLRSSLASQPAVIQTAPGRVSNLVVNMPQASKYGMF